MKQIITILLAVFFLLELSAQTDVICRKKEVVVGAESTAEYFPLIKNKRIGIFTNHTGMIGNVHIVDSLIRSGFKVVLIFSPEHGFRGKAEAGEKVNNGIDPSTGIPVFSLYQNKNGKPSADILSKIDVLLVDIQDVGLRFYTYYISMYKLMDACAENNKKMIILDRPNPNGFYVDGPVLDMKYRSGVGALPIPIVHGMTLGELAQMINGEGWLSKKRICELQVITCKNYTHQTKYQLPIPPSPNLPNMKAVYLYPSICLFEGTAVSLGRGTDFPFQVYGSPEMKGYAFSFTPQSVEGAKNPPFLNKKCYGVDLRNIPDEEIEMAGISLNYLIDAYNNLKNNNLQSSEAIEKFFTPFFQNLVGVDYVEEMVKNAKSNEEIKAVWQADVEKFKLQRKPYLLYNE